MTKKELVMSQSKTVLAEVEKFLKRSSDNLMVTYGYWGEFDYLFVDVFSDPGDCVEPIFIFFEEDKLVINQHFHFVAMGGNNVWLGNPNYLEETLKIVNLLLGERGENASHRIIYN